MYQIEKDWRKAIIAASELAQLEKKDYQDQIAQFDCEIALEAMRRQDLVASHLALDHAFIAVPEHIRATILRGDVYILGQRPKEAITTWNLIEEKYPAFLHLVADQWILAHQELGQESVGLERLVAQLPEHGWGELLDIVYKHVLRLQGAEAAELLMSQVLLKTPTLTVLAKRFEAQYQLALARDAQSSATDLKASVDLLKKRTSSLARYTCSSCGFRAKRFYWQCPGCNHWDVYSPKRSEGLAGL